MSPVSQPLQFLLVAVAGWIHQQQRDVIDYLQAENRVLREQLAAHRVRRSRPWSSGWPRRIARGAIRGSKGRSPTCATAWPAA